MNAAADALSRWPGDVSTPVDNDEYGTIDCLSHTTPVAGEVAALVHRVDAPNSVEGEAISSFPGYTQTDLRKLQETDPDIKKLLEFWPGPKPSNRDRTQDTPMFSSLLKQWKHMEKERWAVVCVTRCSALCHIVYVCLTFRTS